MQERAEVREGQSGSGLGFVGENLWLKRLDDPETESWLAAQEAVGDGRSSSVDTRACR